MHVCKSLWKHPPTYTKTTHTHLAYWKHRVLCTHKHAHTHKNWQIRTVLCSWGWKHTYPLCPAHQITHNTVKGKVLSWLKLRLTGLPLLLSELCFLAKKTSRLWYWRMPSQLFASLQRTARLNLAESVPVLMSNELASKLPSDSFLDLTLALTKKRQKKWPLSCDRCLESCLYWPDVVTRLKHREERSGRKCDIKERQKNREVRRNFTINPTSISLYT